VGVWSLPIIGWVFNAWHVTNLATINAN
jgi:hypothetical protein